MIIYKVTNKINGKIYIGQSSKTDPLYYGSGPIIIKSIKKYGKDNFIRIILEECETKEESNIREIFWIKYFNSTNRNIGYNISNGGNGGNLGPIVNKKISDLNKGLILVKDKYGNNTSVYKDNPRYISGELVAFHKGLVAYNKGVPMSEDQKVKLRGPKTEEHKRKLSEVRIGKGTKKIQCFNNGIVYNSLKEAAEILGLTVPNVVSVLKGRSKKTKGYIFVYFQ